MLIFNAFHIEDDLRRPLPCQGLGLALRTQKCVRKAMAEVLTPLYTLVADFLFHGGQSRLNFFAMTGAHIGLTPSGGPISLIPKGVSKNGSNFLPRLKYWRC